MLPSIKQTPADHNDDNEIADVALSSMKESQVARGTKVAPRKETDRQKGTERIDSSPCG